MPGYGGGVRSLIKTRLAKTDGECAYWLSAAALHQGSDERRVHTSRQKAAQWDIAQHLLFDNLPERRFKLIKCLRPVRRAGGKASIEKITECLKGLSSVYRVDQRQACHMPSRHFTHVLKDALRVRNVAV